LGYPALRGEAQQNHCGTEPSSREWVVEPCACARHRACSLYAFRRFWDHLFEYQTDQGSDDLRQGDPEHNLTMVRDRFRNGRYDGTRYNHIHVRIRSQSQSLRQNRDAHNSRASDGKFRAHSHSPDHNTACGRKRHYQRAWSIPAHDDHGAQSARHCRQGTQPLHSHALRKGR
jgi:hypothetical protein